MPADASTPDTVVVCQPNQLRQAAVVLSCFPVETQPHLEQSNHRGIVALSYPAQVLTDVQVGVYVPAAVRLVRYIKPPLILAVVLVEATAITHGAVAP